MVDLQENELDDSMNYKQLLFGPATYIPGVYRLFSKTGGTDSARYCYAVWLRHLVLAHEAGLLCRVPEAVAEIGPGDSLGTGLAALISGVDIYHALDVVPFSDGSRNLQIFDDLVSLFQARQDIPEKSEFPRFEPDLRSYRFPSNILSNEKLAAALDNGRLQAIRNSLVCIVEKRGNAQHISYDVPWNDPGVLTEASVDMIYSQAVLEHIDDLELTYRSLGRWLKPGGLMSHQVDFTSHRIADKWNGHWAFSKLVWKLVRGNRPYLLNRQPYSTHAKLLKECGFEVVMESKLEDFSGIKRSELAPEFEGISNEDLVTKDAFFQALKKS